MSFENTRLLSPTELLDIYGIPIFNDAERREYFTLSDEETKALKRFKDMDDAVYFAISLVFFKIKKTLIKFSYRETTAERQHVMERYFPNQLSPKSYPSDYTKMSRIENKILSLCDYQRFTGNGAQTIKEELLSYASHHPKQRQLCKALLDLCVKHRVVIPAISTLQALVSTTWNEATERVTQIYLRYTRKPQRDLILTLLDKTDHLHHIVSIKQDMKGFNTEELHKEIDKHSQLKPVFEIAKEILPKLSFPTTTVYYYASLINYYNGPRLKQINPITVQLYLLCYGFTRFQRLNDNILEALKKRTPEYHKKGNDYANDLASQQLALIKETRKKVSDMLIAIEKHSDPVNVPRKIIYRYVPEKELLPTAKLLIDDKFDHDFSYWKYIDSVEDSIKLNLRALFLTVELEVTNDALLKEIINTTKTMLLNNTFSKDPLPSSFKTWIDKADREYLIKNEVIIANRFEYLLYRRIVYYLTTNKVTIKYSVKYKRVEDDLMAKSKWDKKKPEILDNLGYAKLNSPILETLALKRNELKDLYHTVNQAILNGKNDQVILTKNNSGSLIWRLRPLDEKEDPNNSFFLNFQPRSIVDVIQFVNGREHFIKVFEAILPRSTKNKHDAELIMAVVLANAIRLGARQMAGISDLKESDLITTEATYIRMETLIAAIDLLNNASAQFPIYKQWYINSIIHSSLDGLKLGNRLRNVKARFSPKYFHDGVGVSGYNHILNGFSITSALIGANEYEASFLFGLVHQLNNFEIKPEYVSTDKHGTNALNFGLFDLTDLTFAPRIPKPHRETFWGFGDAKDYDSCIIKPTKFMNEQFVASEWDNMQRLVASLLTGEESPSIIISKLSSKNYRSDTKDAFAQYNHIVRSGFLLKYLHDPEFRRAILVALNRGEHFNNLYRAITVLRKGELRGQSEIEMEIWNQCTRLIASIILYYNTYILNSFYVRTNDPVEKAFIASLSPGAWIHVNLLGYYQFCGQFSSELVDCWIKQWDWRKYV